MTDFQHYYKSFPLFGSVGVAEDMTCKKMVWTFTDISSKNLPYKVDVVHVIRKDNLDYGDSKYYGRNTRLNLSERLISENEKLYYIDAMGDKYEVTDDFVVGLKLTTKTPDWIKAKSLFNDDDSLRWLTTAVKSDAYKGFNSAGFLVYLTGDNQRLYRINREDNKITTIEDISDDESKTLYTFVYNSSSGDLLDGITDHVDYKDLSFTYDGDKLKTITQRGNGTYEISYNGYLEVRNVDWSSGYRAMYTNLSSKKMIYVQSLYSSIPGEETVAPSIIAWWRLTFSGNNYTITDNDGNVEHYLGKDDDFSAYTYIKEENGVVTQACIYINDYTQSISQKAHIDSLYVPYDEFDKSLKGERTEIFLSKYFQDDDWYYHITSRKTTGIIIGVNNKSKYSTADITTDYHYGKDNKCLWETSTINLHLCDGTEKTYIHKVEYEYHDNGAVSFKTSYIDKPDLEESDKLVESYGYTFYDDGSYQKRASYYRGGGSATAYRTVQLYDKYNRLTSERDPSCAYDISYNYFTNTSLVRNLYHPGRSSLYYNYLLDGSGSMSHVYYQGSDEEGNSTNIGNFIDYSKGEPVRFSGNDTIRFVYDDERRVKKITIDGNTGSKTLYYDDQTTSGVSEEVVTAVNENGESVKCIAAKDGSYDKIYYNDQLQLQNKYNAKGELTEIEDKLSNETVSFSYNALGQLTSYAERQNNTTKVKQTCEYDAYGNITYETLIGQLPIQTYFYDYEDTADRRFKGMEFAGITEEVTYDNFDRIATKKVTYNGKEIYTKTYDYYTVPYDIIQGKKCATTQPQYIKYQKDGQTKKQIEYKYTSLGNHISEILYDGKSVSYTYSSDCNRLMSETNNLSNVSYSYTYSDEGNIKYRTDKSDWSRTNYTYNGDRMTSYNGQSCVYDNMGNPTTYRGKSATWKGRQMTSFNGVNFTYDGRGRRTGKGNITFLYDSQGRIIKQSNGLEFFYDFEGIAAVKYNSTMYFYQKDAQGNIIGILDSNGNVVVQYYYDAWGNHKVVTADGNAIASSSRIGNINPFRYRGYYYDTETGLYFLQTRYYDPETGRFLNRDSVAYADPETIGGLNLYAYCLNNPVMYSDPTGHSVIGILLAIAGVLVSGAINGFIAADSRPEGESYWGAFAGGFIDGAIGSIGVAAGLAFGAIPGFFVAAGISYVGGFVGSIVSQQISYGNVDFRVAAMQGGVSLLYNSVMYAGLATAGIVAGVKWVSRFIDALKISGIGVSLSLYFANLSFPSMNYLRWNKQN